MTNREELEALTSCEILEIMEKLSVSDSNGKKIGFLWNTGQVGHYVPILINEKNKIDWTSVNIKALAQ